METNSHESKRGRREIVIAAILLLGVIAASVAIDRAARKPEQVSAQEYPWHHGIKATVFWVGEGPDASNDYITNTASTWDPNWVDSFGGVDDPGNRCGDVPCSFTPNENQFYAALPYNDLKGDCKPKESQSAAYWYKGTTQPGDSLLKNRWLEVRNGDKVAYPQIQDAGPFGEDDEGYVFGDKLPQEARAGIDLSPATANQLGIDGRGEVSWRFIDQGQVPEGPWTKTVTTSRPVC
jgi:hypothetical protein